MTRARTTILCCAHRKILPHKGYTLCHSGFFQKEGTRVDPKVKLALWAKKGALGIPSHIIAADTDVDQVTLERLRGRCVNDVKRTNGQIQFKDILQFQREA